jgi:uncharacterized membrane protein YfcA
VADAIVLGVLFFAGALLYASVGHAGASAYLAAMAILGVTPDVARPTALALNIIVASFVTFRFWRQGHISFRVLAPFLIGSIPMAYLGGTLPVAPAVYKQLVGVVLLVAAVGMASTARRAAQAELGIAAPHAPAVPAVLIGGAIGLLSGLTGTGGGIFLSPILLFTGWAQTRSASGLAGAFILGNSIAGLTGNLARLASLPPALPFWAVAVVAGAVIGAEIGSRRGRTYALRTALSMVLVIAGIKLIFIG